MKIRSYKDLDVWKKGIEIVDLVYEVADQFQTGKNMGWRAIFRRQRFRYRQILQKVLPDSILKNMYSFVILPWVHVRN